MTSYLKAILIAVACVVLFSAGYYNGVQYEKAKHLEQTVQNTVSITKENKASLTESIKISENTSEKIQKENEVSNERKQQVARAKTDTDVLRIALPTSIIGVLHDASSR